MQEHDGDELVQLPDGAAFVTPEWVSSCLAQGKRLLEAAHLIDLARMLLLAKLQVGLTLISTATRMKNGKVCMHGAVASTVKELLPLHMWWLWRPPISLTWRARSCWLGCR